MKLADLTIQDFAKELASSSPAPGGGSASALAGALGAGLAAMVCHLTLGKAKYADFHDLASSTLIQAKELQEELLVAIDKDTEAFDQVDAAFGLPKSTKEEKQARSKAIQEALVLCTESPLHFMDLSLKALHLANALIERSNPTCMSDLGVAILMLRTALLGGWLNVKINIGNLKDTEKAAAYAKQGKDILDEGIPLADTAYQAIEANL